MKFEPPCTRNTVGFVFYFVWVLLEWGIAAARPGYSVPIHPRKEASLELQWWVHVEETLCPVNRWVEKLG